MVDAYRGFGRKGGGKDNKITYATADQVAEYERSIVEMTPYDARNTRRVRGRSRSPMSRPRRRTRDDRIE